MSKSPHGENHDWLYLKRNGDVIVRFVKPVRLARKDS